ncbi:MAG: LPP20 family lipoprotein [Spirochaetales bacterium]|nr:LPP20 family lipoprotein [Spirochaetales bacterium]
MKLKSRLLLLILPLAFLSCATSGLSSGSSSSGGSKPQWIDDKHSLYPNDQYLVEIGEGNSLKGAKQDAKASLAQIFRTTIIVDSTVSTRYRDLSDGKTILESEMETTSDESITQLSDETLINVHFAESWTSDLGRVFVVAYINRMETGNIYRQRIDQDGMTANSLINSSAGEDSLLRRYGYLDAAMVMDAKIQSLRDQLDIIYQPFARTVMLPYDSSELRNLYGDTAKEMVYSINIEGDREGKVEAVVSQVLTDRGFSVAGGADASLAVFGRITMEEVILNNDYSNLRWTLFLEMVNEEGDIVVSMDEKKRETAISLTEAEARAYRSMEDAMQKSFLGSLEDYFDSFAGN